MSVRFWRSAGRFAASYIALLCISREIYTVPSLYRPSTDGLMITKAITQYLNHLSMNQHRVLFKHSVIIMAARVMP